MTPTEKLYIEKLKAMNQEQKVLIDFIGLWGKFAELLQDQPESAKFISRQFNKIGVLKKEFASLEKQIEEEAITDADIKKATGHCGPLPRNYFNEAKPDRSYLADCISKAKPNLSKIKDVDKELDEIRGISKQWGNDEGEIICIPDVTDSDIEAWAEKIGHLKDNEIADGIASSEFISGLFSGAKAMRDKKIKHIK